MCLFVTVRAQRPLPARMSLCPCPGEAAGWLGTIIYGKNGFSWVHTDSLSRFIARLLSST